ncbi:MAG: type II toxin-antitoxin system RelE/ParE family toxin [Sphingobacteriaceae bacterium]|nr:MAG: type II toxin-antitoxin system RelE/ParE family toxin [Sphingobacteriaceae bacterium]
MIATIPDAFPVKRNNYRECNIQKFPYVIVYVVDHSENVITVSAIYHTSRKPAKKYR